MKLIVAFITLCCCLQVLGQDKFPDGKLIPDWFRNNESVNINSLGKQYRITDYGVVNDSAKLQTEQIQNVIDRAAKNGGGVIVIPKGTFLSGSLFFKPKTHLYLEENAVLKGSDDAGDFRIQLTRMEGQTVKYYTALINADGIDGFTISGKGMLNGNGFRYWKAFWLRREWNPNCTNMDEQRPRIIYLSNCKNVQIEGISIANSPFWTTHYYKCSYVKLLNLHITSPRKPMEAPSTDAVDLDVCNNVLIKNLSETRAAQYRNQMIGFIFQSFNLISFKNAMENVALPLFYQNISRKQRNIRAMEYLDRLGLKEWAHHLPNEMSGGQKQRVAIARALISQPQIILADEPTGALDSKTSVEVMQILKEVNDSGMTLIVVTHESGVANQTNKIIHLKDGVIESIEENPHHNISPFGDNGLIK